MSSNEGYTFTVGKLDAGVAILIGERASLIEFPSVLLRLVSCDTHIDHASERQTTGQQHEQRRSSG